MWPVTPQFRQELASPVHSVAVRVEFLDTSFRVLRSVSAYSATNPNDVLIDGTVDVDVTRGTRRTLTMSLLNPEGAFTPEGTNFTTSDWDGYFYVNRLIRLFRGIRYENGSEEVVPIGTFMVDKAETLVERGMSTVVIAGSDLWKKFSKSQFGSPRKFTEGTEINTIVSTLASEAGVTFLSLDPLTSRTNASKQIQRDFNFEADETRGEALLKICGDYGIEIFFNPMGVLTTRDFQNPFDRDTVWYYDDEDDLTFFLRTVLSDDRLYNHVVVVGTAKANQDPPLIYKREIKDTDPSSPTAIAKIGDRVFRYESGVLGSQESVDKSAFTIFYRHFLLSQRVALEAVCNPALEGNDVIFVGESKFTRVSRRYLIVTFTIPLVTSKQKLGMTRVIDIAPEQA